MVKIVISQLVIMLIIIFMGFFVKKGKFITKEGEEGVQTILLKVTFPCMMIMALQRDYSEYLNREFLRMFIAGLLIIMVCYFLFLLILEKIFKITPDKAGVYLLGAVFGNVSFMGIPVVNAIFGADAVLVSVANIFAFNLLFFSAGVMACHLGEDKEFRISEILKKIFLNLPMIGIILGYVFFRCSVKIPGILGETFQSVGSASSVLALFVVGFALADVKVRELEDKNMYIAIVLGLIIAPVIAKLIGLGILKDQVSLGVIIITTAMPSGASVAALASSEGRDGVLASKMIFTSTLLCILTVPLIIKFLM